MKSPDNPDVRYNLGRAFLANNQPRDAAREWRRAVAGRPDSLTFSLNLAWLLATNTDVLSPREAIGLAGPANKASRNEPAVLDVLAAAYASDGRLNLAARTAQLAFQRALAAKNTALATDIRRRLDAYQAALRGGADSAGDDRRRKGHGIRDKG
ncbi:MAG: hypothetical protein QM736_18155 [Vicinamibacterales bacterium]